MLGLTTTFAPFGTNFSIPPNAAMARRTRSSGSPPRATARSGGGSGVEIVVALSAGATVDVAVCTSFVGRKRVGVLVGRLEPGLRPQAANNWLSVRVPVLRARRRRKSRREILFIGYLFRIESLFRRVLPNSVEQIHGWRIRC